VSQAGPEDILLAAIGLTETPRPPGPGVRERLFASRARSGKYGIFADRLARFFDLSIADAEALAQRLENPSVFTPFLVDGLELLPVTCGPKCDGAIATVVRIQPGARFPEHAHKGDESMVVLDGGFREQGTEREVWRGEELFSRHGSGARHRGIARSAVCRRRSDLRLRRHEVSHPRRDISVAPIQTTPIAIDQGARSANEEARELRNCAKPREQWARHRREREPSRGRFRTRKVKRHVRPAATPGPPRARACRRGRRASGEAVDDPDRERTRAGVLWCARDRGPEAPRTQVDEHRANDQLEADRDPLRYVEAEQEKRAGDEHEHRRMYRGPRTSRTRSRRAARAASTITVATAVT
jgi:hypothetical protein